MPSKSTPEYWQERRKKGKGEIPAPWEFIAIDGEGIEETGGQSYALLSSSLHNPITRRIGLTTEECLRWLLSLKTKPRQQLVAFAFTYDINKILRTLPGKLLRDLYEKEKCWYEGKETDYLIYWTKGKTFRVIEYAARAAYHDKNERRRSCVVWDVFGFFQGRFIKAIEDYRIPISSDEKSILESGKGSRGEFKWKDLKEITRYNHLECDLLVKLMNNLQNLLRGMGLYLTRWDGAGAIAASLMLKNNVKSHVNRGFSAEVEDAIMRAYFGGRSQCVQFGVFDGPIYHYDINSAYPSSYLDLPSLHGKWRTSDRYLPNEKYVLYQVAWNIPYSEPLTPFPYRDNVGTIRYPHRGRGIYHSILVDAATQYFAKWIKIEKAWVFTPSTDDKPFAWVSSFMEERLRLKREGDLRHITMKLGGNSIYGKTAQGITFGEGLPPYQSYLWAGMITAWTQAQLLKAGLQAPPHIVFLGTDAIFSQVPLDLPIGTSLRTWEDCNNPPISRFEIYQPGLYRMHFPGEEPTTKTRGFHKEEVDFDVLLNLWKEKKFNGELPLKVTRFIGLQIAWMQNALCDWGDWVTVRKNIHLSPGGWGTVTGWEQQNYLDKPPSDKMNFRFEYIDGDKDGISERFSKKELHLPDPDDKLQMELYALENEWLANPDID